jgi:hypothetical protein
MAAAGAGGGGALAGLAAVLPKPLTYPAEATLEIQGINENFMGLAQVDPQASGGIYSATQANILTQVEILNSSSLKQRAAERLERETIPTLPPSGSGLARVFNAVRNAAGLGPSSPVEAMREAIRAGGGLGAGAGGGGDADRAGFVPVDEPEMASRVCERAGGGVSGAGAGDAGAELEDDEPVAREPDEGAEAEARGSRDAAEGVS